MSEGQDVQVICGKIRNSLAGLIEDIESIDPALICNFHSSSNAAYVFRAYASFRRILKGEELAVSVNLKIVGCTVLMTADLCTEDGEVLADGPAEAVQLTQSSIKESMSRGWTDELDKFLARIKPMILAWQK